MGVKLKSTQITNSSQDPHRFVTPSANLSIKRQFKERDTKPSMQETQEAPSIGQVNLISTDQFQTHLEKMIEKHDESFNTEESNSTETDEWKDEEAEYSLVEPAKTEESELILDKNISVVSFSQEKDPHPSQNLDLVQKFICQMRRKSDLKEAEDE
ncbi:MAG: hypothetical protein HWD61_00780 [Parachlamydiaceae bacterium]|nr:MAG: hypothetical protein HWD61_00780 [Parachlamydiaceae bacterium]